MFFVLKVVTLASPVNIGVGPDANFLHGANPNGQLGVGFESESVLVPIQTPLSSIANILPSGVKSICGGASHTLILKKNGTVYSCGSSYAAGHEGVTEHALRFKKVRALDGHTIVQIAAGWDFSAAVSSTGLLFLWGANKFGQLGLPKHVRRIATPTFLEIGDVTEVSCGLRHTAIVLRSGKVIVSGQGSKGQLGLVDAEGKPIQECILTPIPSLENITSVACGQRHTLGLTADGSVFAWGDNKYGQLGIDPTVSNQINTPVKIDMDVAGKEIMSGWTHSALLTADGDIFNCGRNNYGQLGDNRVKTWKPQKLQCEKVIKLSVGAEHNLAISSSNKLLCWGWNEHGNCGNGTVANVECPEQILKDYVTSCIGTGAGNSFAVLQHM